MLHLLIHILCFLQVEPSAPKEKSAQIAVSTRVEEGKKVLVATVTNKGKPVEGVRVAFSVERAFGWLLLGKDTTIDDGTAAVAFPEGLPGGSKGELHVRATAEDPAVYATLSGSATLTGARVVTTDVDAFPRAIWAPRAPIPLILTVCVLLTGVWSTYLFVVIQLARIAKGAKA